MSYPNRNDRPPSRQRVSQDPRSYNQQSGRQRTTYDPDAYNQQPKRQRTPYDPRAYRQPDHRQYSDRPPVEPPSILLSALLGILTVVSLCIFIFLLVIRTANAATIIQRTDVLGVLAESGFAEHSYYITNQLNGLHFHDEELTLEDIEEFIKLDAVSNEIGGVIDGYARAFVQGDLDHHITVDDIVVIARNIEPELEELFDHRLTEAELEHLAESLNDVIDFDSFRVGYIIEDYELDMTIPNLFLGSTLRWIFGLISLGLLAIIFILRRGNIADALLGVGLPFIISGLLSFACGMAMGASPELFGQTFYALSRFLDGPIYLMTQYGFAFAAVGAALIVVSIVINSASPKVTPRY